jgi:hypothetical protein
MKTNHQLPEEGDGRGGRQGRDEEVVFPTALEHSKDCPGTSPFSKDGEKRLKEALEDGKKSNANIMKSNRVGENFWRNWKGEGKILGDQVKQEKEFVSPLR